MRVFLHELGPLIRSQIFAEARNTERRIDCLQAGSQLMCHVGAARERSTSGSDPQARMIVWSVPEQMLRLVKRLLISV